MPSVVQVKLAENKRVGPVSMELRVFGVDEHH